MNYQKLVIVGNVTRDPQRRTSQNGDTEYTTLRVGVSDKKDRPIFFPVTVFGKQAQIVAQYVSKGRQVLVEGRIEADENGRMNVVADRVIFGTSPSKSRAAARTDDQPAQGRAADKRTGDV